jgi:hypothetical protein
MVTVLLGDGSGTPAPQQSYPAVGKPHATVAADFNQDGRADLATLLNTTNQVSVLLGSGSGLQQGPVVPVGAGPRAVAVIDLNGDGKPDLAVANEAEQSVSPLLGDGTGGFGAAGLIPVSAPPWALSTADVDRDGRADLAAATSAALIEVLLGDGRGGVRERRTVALDEPSRFVVTGDGLPDLVVAGSRSVSTLIGDGRGSFSQGQRRVTQSSPTGAALADMNRDGALDLALVEVEHVSVLLGDGRGGFVLWQSMPLGQRVGHTLQVQDVNQDHSPDLVVLGFYSPDVTLLLGDGTGGFGPARSFLLGGRISNLVSSPGRALAVAELTGDGVPDLAVPLFNPDRVAVLPGTVR